MSDDVEPAETLDLEARTLCPDDTCVGVIGADGHCRLCGLAAEPSATATSQTRTVASLEDAEESEDDPPATSPDQVASSGNADEDAVSASPESEGEGDDDRALCPDGSCIGVVGTDGCCKICGLRA